MRRRSGSNRITAMIMTTIMNTSTIITITSTTIEARSAATRSGLRSDFDRFESFRREEFLRFEPALRETLFERVAQEDREGFPVLVEPIGPVIVAHFPPGFLHMGVKPGQHAFQRRRLAKI